MSGYVWYSFGSDTTGPKLAEALGFSSGKKTPTFPSYDLVIGWGCKPGTKYDSKELAKLIECRKLRILNHPDEVVANRDKLATLQRLQEAGVPTPGLVQLTREGTPAKRAKLVTVAVQKGTINYPLIGLNAHGKGQPYFCYTDDEVELALMNNMTKETNPRLDYFRSFAPGTEYRIHVFRDSAIAAQTKTLSADPHALCAEELQRQLARRAKKDQVAIDTNEENIQWVLSILAEEILSSVNNLQRSVARGWQLEDIPLGKVPEVAISVAIDAIEAAGLDLGAVSVTYEESPQVTNITTAPALTDERLQLYVSSIKEMGVKPSSKASSPSAKAKPAREKKAAPEIIARIRRGLSGLTGEKAQRVLKALEEAEE